MKIAKAEIFQLKLNNFRPVICKITTDDGIYGFGEAAVAYGRGSNAAVGMLEELAPLLIGKDPLDNEVIWEMLYKDTFWGQGGGTIVFAAISAIDIALMDIKGKVFQVPVYKLLGGKHNESLRTYASQLQSGWGSEIHACGKPQEYAHAARLAVDEGFSAIKMDFINFDRNGHRINHKKETLGVLRPDVYNMVRERLAAVRDEIGYGIDLIMENHCNSDLVSAVQLAELCEEYHIMFLEEAVTPLNQKLSARLREKTKIPLAGGERIYTRWGYAGFFEQSALQVIQPDLGTCGGLTEGKKICDMAHVYDVRVQAHVCGSPIIAAAALQLEAAIPNFCIHELHFVNTMKGNISFCKYDYQPVNGYYQVPELSGIGQELTDEAMRNAVCYRVFAEN